AIIAGTTGIREAYTTGRGKVLIKSRTQIEEHRGKMRILVSEIPYMVNKAQMIEHIADLVREKRIPGIADIRDESNKEGIRVVIEIKRDADPNVVLNQLHQYSRLSESFGIILLSLVDGEPKVLSLKGMLDQYLLHRRIVVRRRTQFELTKAQDRSHVLEGLIIALNDIDAVVQKIKRSTDAAAAEAILVADYQLTLVQAKAILDMKLQRLASLEQEKIRSEHTELQTTIAQLQTILADEQKILEIIRRELEELKQKYADARRTEIQIAAEGDFIPESLIEDEDVVVTLTHSGYVKRQSLDTYRAQGRGGEGIIGGGTKDEDAIEQLFIASTHSYVLFFTDAGTVHWLKIHEIPEGSRTARGKAVVNLIQLDPKEKIAGAVPVKVFDDHHFVITASRQGTIKKTALAEYSRPRKGGIVGAGLDEGDTLINAVLTDGNQHIILATKNGMAARFAESDARPMGRPAKGVIGISLRDGDEVVDMVIANEQQTLLTVTEHGYGKRSLVADYRLINRGGVGVINIQCTERNGHVVAVKTVTDLDEIMLISKKGIVMRTAAKDISIIGRNTQGVRLMKLDPGDMVVDCARILAE
ncbi:MAG TPA: DNA gyrase C-terminal beta-propeller domain-containing protein, partial [Candidatus Nanoarchaeia archaeon]|nr:DNA gyrase C-terminal beta-propeller domain-containing protein [Candidatus Nanoarchaeia archaeon]